MKKWQKITLGIVVGLLIVAFVGIAVMTRPEGYGLVEGEPEPPDQFPSDLGIAYEDVAVVTEDGLRLVGWWVPADPVNQNGAAVMVQHGYKANRTDGLSDTLKLHQHGYAVLVTTVRAHDLSEGEMISFGKHEMKDLQAWYNYLLERDGVDPDKIGILGISMGGMLSIQYAAENPNIKVVVTHSAFSSLNDTVETSVPYYTGLPAFPFANFIVFWAERKTGIKSSEIDATVWIEEISPRPVMLMHGGADVIVSPQSGHWLCQAAKEPKWFWYEEDVGHTGFDEVYPEEYEARVCTFYDCHLLGDGSACARLDTFEWEEVAQSQ
jgi:dipeptidyl aminopeptidase/acylaminoacyl peptidase